MKDALNRYGQTREWEKACIETRRGIDTRKKRLQKFGFRPTDKILDAGCGDGINIHLLASMGIHDIVGVDISSQLLKLAKKLNPKIRFVQASLEKLPFRANSFDAVLVDSVFHHLLEYELTLTQIRRILKPKGYLCFLEPKNHIFRLIADTLALVPFATYIPFIGKRSRSYLGEIHLMRHWLDTDGDFFSLLWSFKMKKIFLQADFLSWVGKYQKLTN